MKRTEEKEMTQTKPIWLIDLFPCTVPQKADNRYFAVEELFRKDREELCGRMIRILLKLYCYYDFTVVEAEGENENPKPEDLCRMIHECYCSQSDAACELFIELPECNAMIEVSSEDLYLIVLNPDDRLKELLNQLVQSEGLFFYRAPE